MQRDCEIFLEFRTQQYKSSTLIFLGSTWSTIMEWKQAGWDGQDTRRISFQVCANGIEWRDSGASRWKYKISRWHPLP